MSRHVLSPAEFRNAIYLDFEGEGRKKDGTRPKPHMSGIFYPNEKGAGGKYESIFYKSLWRPATNGVRNAESVEFVEHFKSIAAALEQKQSYLVFWSIYENDVLKAFLPAHIYSRIEPRLYNLHPVTKKYLNRKHAFGLEGTAKGKTLEECFAALRTKRKPYPPFPLGAAEACRRIDTACTAHKKWRRFSDKRKSYVRDLVQYNEGDCRSTWIIAKRIGNYFALVN